VRLPLLDVARQIENEIFVLLRAVA